MLNWKSEFLPALEALKSKHKRLENYNLSIVGSSSAEDSIENVNYFQQILNPEEEQDVHPNVKKHQSTNGEFRYKVDDGTYGNREERPLYKATGGAKYLGQWLEE